MQVIYIDVLFALNLIVNYLLLFLTARFSGLYVGRVRLLGGAALGALFSVLMFFPDLPLLPSALFKCLLCAAVTAVTFGKKSEGRLLRLCFIFCSVSFALAGIVLALSLLTGGGGSVALRNGVPYFNVSLKLLLLSSAVAYGILGAVFGGGGLHIARRTAEVEIRMQERSVRLRALVDSGNLLRDPMTGKRVLVTGGALLAPLFSDAAREVLAHCGELGAAESFERLAELYPGVFSLIPYRDASSEFGLIVALRPDCVLVDGQEQDDLLVGAAGQSVETPDGCMAVLGV